MTGSDNYGSRENRAGTDGSTAASRFGSLSHYDLVLAFIPLALVTSLLASNVGVVSLHSAMAIGSTVGALAVIDALFVHAPTPDEEER